LLVLWTTSRLSGKQIQMLVRLAKCRSISMYAIYPKINRVVVTTQKQ